MNQIEIATQLSRSRAHSRPVDAAVLNGPIASTEDAYRIHAQTATLPDMAIRGWKVSALLAQDQTKFGVSGAIGSPLFASYFAQSPVTRALSRYIAPLFECEVAFLLGADLPARAQPYSRADIEAAIEAVVPAFEIADRRVSSNANDFVVLADALGNGDFVAGRATRQWRDLDLGHIAITLTCGNGQRLAGNSERLAMHPVLALTALANARPAVAGGLRKGQIVTTGTCITPVPLHVGYWTADFGPLGTVQMEFA